MELGIKLHELVGAVVWSVRVVYGVVELYGCLVVRPLVKGERDERKYGEREIR